MLQGPYRPQREHHQAWVKVPNLQSVLRLFKAYYGPAMPQSCPPARPPATPNLPFHIHVLAQTWRGWHTALPHPPWQTLLLKPQLKCQTLGEAFPGQAVPGHLLQKAAYPLRSGRLHNLRRHGAFFQSRETEWSLHAQNTSGAQLGLSDGGWMSPIKDSLIRALRHHGKHGSLILPSILQRNPPC